LRNLLFVLLGASMIIRSSVKIKKRQNTEADIIFIVIGSIGVIIGLIAFIIQAPWDNTASPTWFRL